ncbi:MAG: amidohydrolase family protein [Pirellulales bacterium]
MADNRPPPGPSISPPWALRARWLWTGRGAPRENELLTIAGERIVAVGENTSGRPPRDFPDAFVCPGWINSHTHLEFGELTAPLGSPGDSFSDWLGKVVRDRRAALATRPADELAQERSRGIRAALRELTQSGVTTVGEIARPGWPAETGDGPPAATIFLELLGLSPERLAPLLQLAEQHLAAAASLPVESASASPAPHWRAGLSPHAPYTVSLELVERVCALSRDARVPVAMHLAESWDELELLSAHSGPLVDVLRDLDAWNPASLPRGLRPVDYLQRLATADRALVVHGNFLSSTDWDFLAGHRDRLSVVYCPRTQARFVPTRYPLAEMLEHQVRVVLGTDSRATNPDLDFLAELRWVATAHPEVEPARLLELVTAEAAAALGWTDRGELTVGSRADLVLLGPVERDPWQWMLQDTAAVCHVFCGGQRVGGSGD